MGVESSIPSTRSSSFCSYAATFGLPYKQITQLNEYIIINYLEGKKKPPKKKKKKHTHTHEQSNYSNLFQPDVTQIGLGN